MTPYNLDALRTSMAELISTRRHLADDPISRQKLVEESAVDDARNRLNHQLQQLDERGLSSVSVMNSKKSIQKWMWDWYEALTPRIEEEIKAIIASEEQTRGIKMTGTDRLNVGPFLSLLKPNQLALITIMEVLRLHGSGGIAEGMKTARALIQVGIAVENEYTALLRKRELNKRPNLERFDREATPGSLSDELDSAIPPAVPSSAPSSNNVLGMAGGLSHVVARREAAKRDALVENVTIPEWSRALQARIGGVLVDALMDTATVVRTTTLPNGETYTETQPAFNHEYEYLRGKKLGVIKLNPEVAAEFASKDSTGSGATLNPRHLPMFVPPRPWVSHNSGAYFYNRSTVMRIKDSIEQQQYVREASQNGNLELIFSALDVLGSTPWVVNREVFNVVLEVWNSGVGLADIPPTDLELPDPEKPADYDTNDVAKKEYLQDLKEVINKRRNNHSDRCSTNYKLEIARAFLPDKFYFPHNLDFRGRAYPIPPHLNHIGDDLSRGLLKFAEKRPLGVAGLRWLKIHLANVSGYDKASFDEREAWTMNHLEEIRDSARKPLEGNRWWTKSDDPWQTLATCKELTEALDLEDPTLFESNLPVHQDGTCNGLQHYAALGGDSVGAKQVNLDVTERPSDVYTYVANMVDKDLERDAANGDPIAQMLLGRIARKTVKQTVMTTVYGVTFVGARAQIEKQLRTAGDLDRDQLWKGSTYLARRTLNAIGTLFSGATAIQTWLSFVARIISKSIPPERVERSFEPGPKLPGRATPALTRANTEQMASVIWTTAMGLPIVQPYRKTKKKQLMTPVQSVFISDPNMQSQVNPMKQSSAFPPNFIHSLDATHMMLTALECRREELTFASVHDSYWTHACTVDRMSELIRNTFVYLHESDILAKLLDEFRTRYAGYQVPVMSLNQREIDHINATTDAEDSTTLAAEVASNPEAANLDVTVTRQTKRSPSSPTGEKTTTKAALAKQYVLLTDILPPLPAKGDFTVETIKKSLYFFS
ncbi:DNA/RNA polymerase [Clavulina sp. PMI_390]|nr:DNA/RNA polymerase [Clavulina sp. PMI_390]